MFRVWMSGKFSWAEFTDLPPGSGMDEASTIGLALIFGVLLGSVGHSWVEGNDSSPPASSGGILSASLMRNCMAGRLWASLEDPP